MSGRFFTYQGNRRQAWQMMRYPGRQERRFPRDSWQMRARKYRRAQVYPVISPRTMTVKLRYSIPYSIALTSTTGSVGENLFRANSVFDPDLTGSGLQPRGFDQYMALYDHFCVLGSKITARFHYLTSSETINSGLASVLLNDQPLALETYTKIQESRYRKIKPMNSASGAKTITLRFSTRKFFGRGKSKHNLLNDATLSGSAIANPGEDAIFHVQFHTVAQTSATVYVTGWIDYIVCFHEPKQPPQS